MIVRRTYLPLLVLMALTCGACASGRGVGGRVPRPFPGAALPPQAGETPRAGAPAIPEAPNAAQTETVPDPVRAELVATALSLRGLPYRNGGSDPSGFDCSGFVQWVFAQHATRLPREAQDQYHAGNAVAFDGIQPGDLVFFETVSRGASHVGVAIGADQFVHAPSSQGVVRVESYTAPYWATRFIGARRVVAATGAGTR